VDAHFRDAFADRLAIAEIAVLGTYEPRLGPIVRQSASQNSNSADWSNAFMPQCI
jgi:hypothetical protein